MKPGFGWTPRGSAPLDPGGSPACRPSDCLCLLGRNSPLISMWDIFSTEINSPNSFRIPTPSFNFYISKRVLQVEFTVFSRCQYWLRINRIFYSKSLGKKCHHCCNDDYLQEINSCLINTCIMHEHIRIFLVTSITL